MYKVNVVLSLELEERMLLKRILENAIEEYDNAICESRLKGDTLAAQAFSKEKKVIVDILGEL